MEHRDKIEVDVLFVGAGVASLSGAIHLMHLERNHNEYDASQENGVGEPGISVAVLEKGAYLGAHNLSGAIIDPSSLKNLFPDFKEKNAPLESEVMTEDSVFLTTKKALKIPFAPTIFKNHGCYVVSVSRLTEWLGDLAEKNDVDVFPGFAGTEVLYKGNRVVGVRTGDKGLDKEGKRKDSYEPGIDIHAKVTVFGEGSRGNLTQSVIEKFGLDKGKNPQNYILGIKEVWEVPEGKFNAGRIIHTFGHPHNYKTYGGGFVYGMKDNTVSLGLITGLNYQDPFLDPHREFQKFKAHPFIKNILSNGKLIRYGAKTAPVGGYYSIPKLAFEGGVIVGDSANLFNSKRLKGIHVAIKSGILAAETIHRCLLKKTFSAAQLSEYEQALFRSEAGKELYLSRNHHQAFQKRFWMGLIKAGFQHVLGGRIIKDRLSGHADFMQMSQTGRFYGVAIPSTKEIELSKPDGVITFDKETSLYYSGTSHSENQPLHLKITDPGICTGLCWEYFQSPCQRFCPANVYEMEVDEKSGNYHLNINAANCLHCKTCEVKDPFENIEWMPPEGEGGPRYTFL